MLTFLCALLVVGIILLVSKLRRPNILTEKCVHIVVLGDLGRSPRMCNHAIQFDKHKFNVHLIGYAGWLFENIVPVNKNIN
jgi:beta-1,4-mannosyltransferase